VLAEDTKGEPLATFTEMRRAIKPVKLRYQLPVGT
jgi:hypothetical protein